jgi:hypothetical protein
MCSLATFALSVAAACPLSAAGQTGLFDVAALRRGAAGQPLRRLQPVSRLELREHLGEAHQ